MNISAEKFCEQINLTEYSEMIPYYSTDKNSDLNSSFKTISLYTSTHTINDKKIIFFTINNIEVHENMRSHGKFSELLTLLEHKKIPLMIDNIINHRLFAFLTKRDYKNYKYQIGGGWHKTMYFLPEE